METFIHDPLVEWNSNSKKTSASAAVVTSPAVQSTIAENEEARKILSRIDMKLKGNLHLDSAAHYCLSEEAQMKELIKEATSIDNLSEMYVGWAPFM